MFIVMCMACTVSIRAIVAFLLAGVMGAMLIEFVNFHSFCSYFVFNYCSNLHKIIAQLSGIYFAVRGEIVDGRGSVFVCVCVCTLLDWRSSTFRARRKWIPTLAGKRCFKTSS